MVYPQLLQVELMIQRRFFLLLFALSRVEKKKKLMQEEREKKELFAWIYFVTNKIGPLVEDTR